jgi:glycine/D-amino acid oxidase-like deaminating enzyme
MTSVDKYDIAIIGGGITGAATAWYLSTSGAKVVLFEEADLNTKASGRNAGSLHGQIQHAPFVERGENWSRSFGPALSFLTESLRLWGHLSDNFEGELEVTVRGGLLVGETSEQMRDIERKVRIEQSMGIPSQILDRDELHDVAPYISPSMAGAELCPLEGKANPLLAVPALAREASMRGVTVRTHARVVGIEIDGQFVVVETTTGKIRCKKLVCAAGSGLMDLARLLGIRLPLMEEPVQVSATEGADRFVDHLVYFAGAKLTLKQAAAGTVLIGGGWPSDIDPITGDARVNLESLRKNLAVARHVVPGVSRLHLIRTWPGIGLATPDLGPIIGELGHPSILLGIYPHMGFTAGPLMGKVLARLALELDPEIDLIPFAPDRF